MTNEPSANRLRLYLIRHGEVEGAKSGCVYGRTDVPLSQTGIAQSRRLADRLENAKLSAVYSSDLSRATATAEIIAQRHGLIVQTNSAWGEIDMGQWDGRSLADLYQQNQQSVQRLFEQPELFAYPDGESFAAFNDRIQKAVKELVSAHTNTEIALVAHAGVARAIIGAALEIPMRSWLRVAQGFGCTNVIDWYDLNPIIQSVNHT